MSPRLCLFCSAHSESSLRAGPNKHNLGDNGMDTPVDTIGTLDPEFLEPLLNCALGELGVILDEFQIVRR